MTDKQCLLISIVAAANLAIIIAVYYFWRERRQERRETGTGRKLDAIPFSEVKELVQYLSAEGIKQLKTISDGLRGAGFKPLADLLVGEEEEFRHVLGNADFGIYAEVSFDQNSGNFLISLVSYGPEQTLVTSQRDRSYFENEPFLNHERHSPETKLETLFSTHLHKLIKSLGDKDEKKTINKQDYLARRLRSSSGY
jgi:hypothetical protein